MEAFPAADEEQLEFIKSVIDRTDFYVLIIAGRYGSVAPDGMSYTEKEYHYAIEKGVPVLVFIHQDIESLPAAKVEKSGEARDRLGKFIESATSSRLRRTWNTIDGLKLNVREALDHAKATKKRPGWIRGDSVARDENLQALVKLQRENAKLLQERQQPNVRKNLPFEPAGLDATISLKGTGMYSTSGRSAEYAWEKDVSLEKVFTFIGPFMQEPLHQSSVQTKIGEHFRNPPKSGVYKYGATITDGCCMHIRIQLEAAGLVKIDRRKTTSGTFAMFWTLTERGTEEMLLRTVIPKAEN